MPKKRLASSPNAETVCDHATSTTVPPGDCPWDTGFPCNTGVAIEESADHIRLTSQMQAGWYRYTMRWEFFLDGTIMPSFGFGIYNSSCSSASHRHHNYWRFDFDIDDAGNDFAQEVEEGGPTTVFDTEVTRTWNGSTTTWEVMDSVSGRGYRIRPGSKDLALPADSFSKLDFMASLYKSNELRDGGSGCAINEGTLADGESISNADVLLWYRAGAHDVVGQDIMFCKVRGPILEPIGNWNLLCGENPGGLMTLWQTEDTFYDQNGSGNVDVADIVHFVNLDCLD